MSETPGTPDTPGRRAVAVMDSIRKDIVFKTPVGVPKRRNKQKVLEEEEYIEQMGKIIQRDFFPDLEKLKVQNEYLDAMEKNDVIKMRELHLRYTGKRPPTQRMPSPATFETPANIHNSQSQPENERQEEIIDLENTQKEPQLSLDQYLNSHTSQDNQSFEEILHESEQKQRQKYSYLYNEEENSSDEQRKMLALPSVEEQAALPEKKFILDTWSYKNRNSIMFIPDGVALTPDEEIERNKLRQEVVHCNTRLKENPFNETQSKETINELAKTQAKVLDGKIGVDGKELLQNQTPNIGGWSFVKTPSPHPGVLDSPLMTWGQIEGTPFRLDGSDTPLPPRSQGPSFKMSEPPKREQLAFALADRVGEKNRDRKKKAMDAARRHFASPSPRPNTSALDRLATMSPAARRLANARLKFGSPAAITPTPSPTRRAPGTPRQSTPKLNLGIKKATSDNLTDGLLKIDVALKRNKASDFF